jgi:peptidoglycan/LPS O-acetylase OafA/YrhL
LRSSKKLVDKHKPARLNALTGLRCFAAINIVLFHFSNPDWFGWFSPIVNAGFASVSFFILLSGFVLGYNYADRARAGALNKSRFWEARFTRLYPVYLLSLLMAWKMVPAEYAEHSHRIFWSGMAFSPLLLQGWIPEIATFLNTPAWTMSAEAAFYFAFPWIAKGKRPTRVAPYLGKMSVVWILGLLPGVLYALLNPDGLAHLDRWSTGSWLQVLKYTPLPHLPGFIFGVMLANLDALMDESVPRKGRLRLVLGLAGFAGVLGVLELGPRVPYAIVHDGLMMPLFGCAILGLAGENVLSTILGWSPLVFVGEASYCLYLLHFNLWNLIHDSHILDRTGLIRFDPWLSYVLLIAMAVLVLYLVEKPAQRWLRRHMGMGRSASDSTKSETALLSADRDGP